MSQTQTKIGNALLRSLIELREQKGQIRIEDVGEMFEKVASTLHTESPTDSFLRNEIIRLADYITTAKKEIFGMVPSEDDPRNIGKAGEELTAVVRATEEATNIILDAADEIQGHVTKLPKSDEASKINDATIRIYDASNFQDITGQRITKVIKTLEYVEATVARLICLFSESPDELSVAAEKLKEMLKDKRPDAELMHGPSLKPPTQDEIDSLFNGVKAGNKS
ncbi:MAG: protein phosphatase CheZ [Rickettsiales bacterium]